MFGSAKLAIILGSAIDNCVIKGSILRGGKNSRVR